MSSAPQLVRNPPVLYDSTGMLRLPHFITERHGLSLSRTSLFGVSQHVTCSPISASSLALLQSIMNMEPVSHSEFAFVVGKMNCWDDYKMREDHGS